MFLLARRSSSSSGRRRREQGNRVSSSMSSSATPRSHFYSSLAKIVNVVGVHFGDEFPAWLKWKCYDLILAIILLHLVKFVRNPRVASIVNFMLEY